MVDVLVEFNYDAEQEDELSIKIGDVIKNVVMSEGGWWEGELNGKKGMFPDNFVTVIKEKKEEPKKELKKEEHKKDVQASKRQSVRDLANKIKDKVSEIPTAGAKKKEPSKRKKAKVLFSYEPENDDELKLEVGDILEIHNQVEEGWWEGGLHGKSGMFPSNFVEVIEEDSGSGDRPESGEQKEDFNPIKGKKVVGVGLGNIFGEGPIKLRSTGKKPPQTVEKPETKEKKVEQPPVEEPVVIRRKQQEKAVVRYSYTAENDDELTLQEGDVLVILEKELEDSGWWKGQLNDKVGVFPDNFVELIKEEKSEEKPLPRTTPVTAPTPQPQPKPKKPPPPTTVPPIKQAPKLPEKAPVAENAPSKQEHPKHEHKEERQATPPIIPTKKVSSQPPPPIGKKPHKPAEPPIVPESHRKEDKHEHKEESSTGGFDALEPVGEKLVHLTASRAKGPSKRPPSQEGETNGDVKESHWVKEDRSHQGSIHANIPPAISEKKEEQTVKEKSHTPPIRPPEPSAATASLHASIEELRRELRELRNHTVSKAAFNELKAENEQLKRDIESVKNTHSRRLKDIMQEVDEEKKLRLGTQVEIERIRKLVAESHV